MKSVLRAGALASVLAAMFASPSGAGEHRSLAVPMPSAYRQECGSCHVPYPPGLLPAESWQRVMRGLPNHFGTDASLDAATSGHLATWLAANAATYRRVSEAPSQDRITRSAWFVREHREVPLSAWKLPAVKSASNCAACHAQAEQGDFDEHSVRIPR